MLNSAQGPSDALNKKKKISYLEKKFVLKQIFIFLDIVIAEVGVHQEAGMADVEEHLVKFAHQVITDPADLRRGHQLQQVLALVLGDFFYLNSSKLFHVKNFFKLGGYFFTFKI